MSFDLKKYLANNPLLEREGFKKGSWEYLTDKEKSELTPQELDLFFSSFFLLSRENKMNCPGASSEASPIIIPESRWSLFRT